MADPVSEHRRESEADLVRAAQAGCPDAFTELFRRHYPGVRRACLRRLGNSVDADEAAQVTFVKALERIEQCGEQRRFGPWVHVIAHRVCVDTVRARARTHVEAVPVSVDRPSTDAGDPEESVLVQERVRILMDAVAQLPHRQRAAVVARTVDERGPGEIAAELGLTVGAVDSLLLRARRRLARAYHHVADERGAAAATAISAATIASGAAARPRRLASALSAAVGHVHHNALQLASTVGLLPATRPAGTGVATAVLTAVLAVHTAAPPPTVADREAPFASPPASAISVLAPVPLVPDESVGASAVSGSLTALVGGLLDAARPPAPDSATPSADVAASPASPSSSAAPLAPDVRRPAVLVQLAEAVLGPLPDPSTSAADRSGRGASAADPGLAPSSGSAAAKDSTLPPAAGAADPTAAAPPDPQAPPATAATDPATAAPPADGSVTTADPSTGSPATARDAPAPPPKADPGAAPADGSTRATGPPPTTTPPADGGGELAQALRTVQDVRDGLKKGTP